MSGRPDVLVRLAWQEVEHGPRTARELAEGATSSSRSYAWHLSQFTKSGAARASWDNKADCFRYSVTDWGHQLLGASGPRLGGSTSSKREEG